MELDEAVVAAVEAGDAHVVEVGLAGRGPAARESPPRPGRREARTGDAGDAAESDGADGVVAGREASRGEGIGDASEGGVARTDEHAGAVVDGEGSSGGREAGDLGSTRVRNAQL